MVKETQTNSKLNLYLMPVFFLFVFVFNAYFIIARPLTIPVKHWGICIGNQPHFSGLRFNLIDNNIEVINGINVTFWKPQDKHTTGTVNGLSLGLIPYAETLNGIQIGFLGSGAKQEINGITIGLIGCGCGGDMKGINIGGLGTGSGGNLIGFNLGLLGAGAGKNFVGVNIGGLGIGAGNNMTGLNIGGLGLGAGKTMKGINIAGLGAGAGDKLTGLNICGIGAGAPTIKGVSIAGFGLGGRSISGLSLALGTIQVKNGGVLNGLAVSAFNYIRGTQRGIAIGIVNYAFRLKGVQIGLLNIVRDNPRGRTVLPIVNFCF
jgi:hypothetical protein